MRGVKISSRLRYAWENVPWLAVIDGYRGKDLLALQENVEEMSPYIAIANKVRLLRSL